MTKGGFNGGKMTIDKLAIIMGKSFKHIDERFDAMDVRFDGIDARLDKIENILIEDDRKRITMLEDKMLQVEVTIGKKLS